MTRPRQTQGDPEFSPTLTLRTQKSFKHRFNFDENEADELSSPAKRPRLSEPVPFNLFGRSRQRDTRNHGMDERGHRRGQRGSSTPLSAEMKSLQDSYSHLGLTLHSTAMAQLEAAQEHLTADVVAEIRANQLRVAQRSAAHDRLTASILRARTAKTTTTTSPGGGTASQQRSELVDMAAAAAAFDGRVRSAAAELQRLRAEWDDAAAEIEAVGRELQACRDLEGGAGAALEKSSGSGSSTEFARELRELVSEHGAAAADLHDEVEVLGSEAVAEYRRYEKTFLKKIEAEAGKVMQSIVHSGF